MGWRRNTPLRQRSPVSAYASRTISLDMNPVTVPFSLHTSASRRTPGGTGVSRCHGVPSGLPSGTSWAIRLCLPSSSRKDASNFSMTRRKYG